MCALLSLSVVEQGRQGFDVSLLKSSLDEWCAGKGTKFCKEHKEDGMQCVNSKKAVKPAAAAGKKISSFFKRKEVS